jgi:hypothetical protein
MVETKVTITIKHELGVKGNLSVEEINSKIREHLNLNGTSEPKFWELGKQFCYEDSYPTEMTISTKFEV